MVNEPYLMVMREEIEGLRWRSGLSGFYKNEPDSSVSQLLPRILEQRKTPTSQKSILVMLFQYSYFDLFSYFAMCVMWRCGAILIGLVLLVTRYPVIDALSTYV
jgi:hypothetical protein